ncbi:MAG: DUF1501 domain-containing protein [Acidobacteria bacterium]|nr:DUF1501 domain-containing protein [Acidobacteriota bacterium]
MKDRFGIDASTLAGTQFWRRPQLGRRMFFRHMASAMGGYFLLPGRSAEHVAKAAVSPKGSAKNCIFVFMDGGPSHVDTFDLKEGAWTPASFQPTSFGDIRFPRGLMPALADQLDNVAFLRSVKAYALVHGLAKTWVNIGRNPTAGTAKIAPHIGSVVSMELVKQQGDLPAFVALNTPLGVGPGYLPPEYGPFYITPNGAGVGNTKHGYGPTRFDRRYGLLLSMDTELRYSGELGAAPNEMFSYNFAARKLMYNSDVDSIFTFGDGEKNRYGNSGFGNSCIAARNLLRARSGVRFIQITQGNWDQHDNIYAPNNSHVTLAKQFDSAIGPLLADLKNDGLLDETLVVAMGEFGRVPGPLNPTGGRDHYLQQTVLMAGGGVKGKRVIGATDRDGRATTEPGWSRQRDIRNEDLEATIYSALGIDWSTVRRDDPLGRGFEYVPFSDRDLYGPVHELWE